MRPANYTASSGFTYRLFNHKTTAGDAETMCQAQGGHLASFASGEEQQEVEDFLIGNVSGPRQRGRRGPLACSGRGRQ